MAAQLLRQGSLLRQASIENEAVSGLLKKVSGISVERSNSVVSFSLSPAFHCPFLAENHVKRTVCSGNLGNRSFFFIFFIFFFVFVSNLSLQVSAKSIQDNPAKKPDTKKADGEDDDDEEEEDDDLVVPSTKRLMKMNKPEFPLMFFGALGAMLFGVVMPLFGIIFSEMLEVSFSRAVFMLSDYFISFSSLHTCACG